MLYKACLDPTSHYSLPLYDLLPLHHLLLISAFLQLLFFNRLPSVPLAKRFQFLPILDLLQGRFAMRIDRENV